jgi:CHAT domain-containing protein
LSIDGTTQCPSDDTLAAFVDGNIDATTRAAVLAHLESCPECMAAVLSANAHREEEAIARPAPGARPRWWLMVAAAVLVAIVAVPLMLRRNAPSLARLVALAPDDARTVEPRLSGGFPWAPYRGPLRATGAATDPDRLKLGGVAGELAQRAKQDPSPEAQHGAGVAMVVIEQPEEAIAHLEAAAAKAPDDAATWSDLAASRYAAAAQLSRASLLPEALAAADRALRIDPRLPEGRFNRALILERLGLAEKARVAWQAYLEVDAGSPWAAEARQRLSALPVTTTDAQFRGELPRLEQSALDGDTAAVASLVGRFPQQSRAYAEAETLGRWGMARNNEDDAVRLLTIARRVGDALVPIAGESLLRDAVAAVDGSDPSRRALLAEAHQVYRRGRIAFSRQELSAAEPDLRLAASRFEAAGSPMALAARYYAASVAYARNESGRATGELESLLPTLDTHPRFASLGAHVRWELALCRIHEADWEDALTLLEASAATFSRLGERGNLASVESIEATTLVSLGRPDDAWAARLRAFAALSAAGASERLAVSIGGAARMAMRAGRADAATSLLRLEEESVRGNDVLLANVLVRESTLDAARGGEAALMHAENATAAAQRITDPALRTRAENDARFATAAAVLPRDPRRAKELLDAAIAGYEERQMPAFLPESYLLRAGASLRLGANGDAARDLESGIAVIERHPVQLGETVSGTGVLDAGTALFEEAILLALERGDVRNAFAYAERAHGAKADAVSAETVAALLQKSGAAVLELVALPREVVAFCVTADGLTVSRHPFDRARLTAMVARAQDGDEAPARELYDVLIRPAEASLASARQLVVVAGPQLGGVPFAALYDASTKRYLIQRMSVALAPSASALRAAVAGSPHSVLATAVSSGSEAVGLPATGQELAGVARLYGRSVAVPAGGTFAGLLAAASGAEVLHIAGHTERQPGRGDAALVFARDAGGAERVSWKTISKAPLGGLGIVVLSACETLRTPDGPEQRALSLGGGFLAAGASAVIGTLTPIADTDARVLFLAVHRELATGAGAAEAVRRAQIEALTGDPSRRRGGWRSVALLTNRIWTN